MPVFHSFSLMNLDTGTSSNIPNVKTLPNIQHDRNITYLLIYIQAETSVQASVHNYYKH